MTYVALVLRVLLGSMFVVFGANYFLGFIAVPVMEEGKPFLSVLGASGYLAVVKVLEIVGGLLMAAKRTTPLGLVVLTPIILNILMYELCFIGKPGVSVVLLAFAVVSMIHERRFFAPFFTGRTL